MFYRYTKYIITNSHFVTIFLCLAIFSFVCFLIWRFVFPTWRFVPYLAFCCSPGVCVLTRGDVLCSGRLLCVLVVDGTLLIYNTGFEFNCYFFILTVINYRNAGMRRNFYDGLVCHYGRRFTNVLCGVLLIVVVAVLVFVLLVFAIKVLDCFFPVEEGVLCAGAGWAQIIGPAAKGVTGIASALFGGLKAAKARKKAAREMKRAQEAIQNERGFNDALFTREYYQDYLQRSENQAALKVLRDRLKRQNQGAAQMAVVTGATPEAVAKQKEMGNEVMGNTVSQIAAHSSNVKDNVLNRYQSIRQNLLENEQALYGLNANFHNQSARQFANLMANGLDNLATSFTDMSNGAGGGLAGLIGGKK